MELAAEEATVGTGGQCIPFASASGRSWQAVFPLAASSLTVSGKGGQPLGAAGHLLLAHTRSTRLELELKLKLRANSNSNSNSK